MGWGNDTQLHTACSVMVLTALKQHRVESQRTTGQPEEKDMWCSRRAWLLSHMQWCQEDVLLKLLRRACVWERKCFQNSSCQPPSRISRKCLSEPLWEFSRKISANYSEPPLCSRTFPAVVNAFWPGQCPRSVLHIWMANSGKCPIFPIIYTVDDWKPNWIQAQSIDQIIELLGTVGADLYLVTPYCADFFLFSPKVTCQLHFFFITSVFAFSLLWLLSEFLLYFIYLSSNTVFIRYQLLCSSSVVCPK